MDRRHFIGTTAALAAGLGADSARANTPSTLTFVGWSQDEAASRPTLTALFDGYRAASGGRLELVGFPWAQMQQNVLLRLRSGQALDVVQLAERWLPQFGATGRMQDLNALFGKERLARQLNPGVLALGEYRGRQLGLPWTAGSIGLVANGKVLRNAGVHAVPRTVDEFLAVLVTLKKSSPDSVPYAMCSKNNNALSPDFQVWLWTFGGRLFGADGRVAVNSAAGVRALGFLVDLVRQGLMAKDIDRPDARRLFAQHQTGFYHDAPLARGFARSNSGQGVDFDRHVLAMPTPVLRKGDAPQSLAWGHLLGVFNGAGASLDAQSPQARLLAHLALSDDSQLRYFREVGLFPVTQSALAQLASDEYVTDWTQAARTASRDELSFWPNPAELTAIVGEEVQAAMLGQKTAQVAIESMGRRLEAKTSGLKRI